MRMLRFVNVVAAYCRRRNFLRLGGALVAMLATSAGAALGQTPMRQMLSPPSTSPSTPEGSMIFSDRGAPEAPPASNAPYEYLLNSEAGSPGKAMPGGPPDDFGGPPPGEGEPNCPPPPSYCPWLTKLGFRHSYTHGRNVGWGWPMVGSSWLNRPFYAGAELGPIWMTRGPDSDVRGDTDLLGGLFIGYDWDYYWGSELQYEYATPNLVNHNATPLTRSNRLVTWNYSLMYYPWGDSTLRPYWRFGIGGTDFDVPQPGGPSNDATLLTFPVGIGLQYPIQRWLAARTELTDNYCVEGHGLNSQHLITWNLSLEWRFGFHKESYWPWNPSSHLW
jgi:Outer membrane protein beta-barrel domain